MPARNHALRAIPRFSSAFASRAASEGALGSRTVLPSRSYTNTSSNLWHGPACASCQRRRREVRGTIGDTRAGVHRAVGTYCPPFVHCKSPAPAVANSSRRTHRGGMATPPRHGQMVREQRGSRAGGGRPCRTVSRGARRESAQHARRRGAGRRHGAHELDAAAPAREAPGPARVVLQVPQELRAALRRRGQRPAPRCFLWMHLRLFGMQVWRCRRIGR